MDGVVVGFAVVGLAIAVGYLLGRTKVLGPEARPVLVRLTFYVLSPFLLFVVLARADVHALFSGLLGVSALAAVGVMAAYALIARVLWDRNIGETLVGSLSAGQVNSNNIGIPLSLYLLGSAAYPAPIILMQLLAFTPISLSILEAITGGTRSWWVILRRTLTNPVIVGSALGVIVALSGISIPDVVWEPISLIANACVPVLLINYGLSLYGQRVLGARGRRRDVLLATALKLVAMPLLAWGLAVLFGFSQTATLIVVTLAALPTAQNIGNYAQRYEIGESIARETILLTTIGCVPLLLVIHALLA